MLDIRKLLAAGLAAATLGLGLAGCAGTRHQESTGEYVDDAAVTTKVKAAFVKDKDVSALDIKVQTFKGTVQLSGFAPSQDVRYRAEQIARATPGVKAVSNDIQLK
ncbi:MAG: BON domain-containing protein [Rhodocyclaceae bacterium]|nr:BON domain-containing protein [Rhodocyclaceae bacterium]